MDYYVERIEHSSRIMNKENSFHKELNQNYSKKQYKGILLKKRKSASISNQKAQDAIKNTLNDKSINQLLYQSASSSFLSYQRQQANFLKIQEAKEKPEKKKKESDDAAIILQMYLKKKKGEEFKRILSENSKYKQEDIKHYKKVDKRNIQFEKRIKKEKKSMLFQYKNQNRLSYKNKIKGILNNISTSLLYNTKRNQINIPDLSKNNFNVYSRLYYNLQNDSQDKSILDYSSDRSFSLHTHNIKRLNLNSSTDKVINKNRKKAILSYSTGPTKKKKAISNKKNNGNIIKSKRIIKTDIYKAKNEEGNTLLHEYIIKNQIELCKYVIEKNPKLINIKNNELNTPLHLAVFYNNYEIAKLLLERGAKVNEKNIMKITPLVLSHKLKHPQMERLIYKYLIMTLQNKK